MLLNHLDAINNQARQSKQFLRPTLKLQNHNCWRKVKRKRINIVNKTKSTSKKRFFFLFFQIFMLNFVGFYE